MKDGVSEPVVDGLGVEEPVECGAFGAHRLPAEDPIPVVDQCIGPGDIEAWQPSRKRDPTRSRTGTRRND
ncbi:hypothetical protein [Kribbella sancticallisti]|uniref:hypothetical protein n=1 Tax=Kribbella sancticallisti TaxID=460087 RepID=UPI0031DA4BA2